MVTAVEQQSTIAQFRNLTLVDAFDVPAILPCLAMVIAVQDMATVTFRVVGVSDAVVAWNDESTRVWPMLQLNADARAGGVPSPFRMLCRLADVAGLGPGTPVVGGMGDVRLAGKPGGPRDHGLVWFVDVVPRPAQPDIAGRLIDDRAGIAAGVTGITEAGSFWYLEPGEYQLDKPWMKAKVWTGALLCGPDAIVIAAANHIPASREAPENIPVSKDVTVTVRLPDFLASVAAFEATPDGEVPVPCSVDDGKAVFKIDAIETGRVFVLRRK